MRPCSLVILIVVAFLTGCATNRDSSSIRELHDPAHALFGFVKDTQFWSSRKTVSVTGVAVMGKYGPWLKTDQGPIRIEGMVSGWPEGMMGQSLRMFANVGTALPTLSKQQRTAMIERSRKLGPPEFRKTFVLTDIDFTILNREPNKTTDQ